MAKTEAYHRVQIHIVACRNLPAADVGGTSDPYVECFLISPDGKKVNHAKTETIEKDLNPDWTQGKRKMLLWEPFKGIKWSGFKKSEISLLFRVMDKDLVGKDDFLGQLQLNLEELEKAGNGERWFNLKDEKLRTEKGHGEIKLRIEGVPASA